MHSLLGQPKANKEKKPASSTRLTRIKALRTLRDRRSLLEKLALEAFGDENRAAKFLSSPHALLGGETPQTAAQTNEGKKKVETILNSIIYGLPA